MYDIKLMTVTKASHFKRNVQADQTEMFSPCCCLNLDCGIKMGFDDIPVDAIQIPSVTNSDFMEAMNSVKSTITHSMVDEIEYFSKYFSQYTRDTENKKSEESDNFNQNDPASVIIVFFVVLFFIMIWIFV